MRSFAQRLNLRSATIYIPLIAGTLILLTWRLGTIPPMSRDEIIAAKASSSFSNILNNPIYLPHKLLQLAAHQLGNSPLTLRLPSVIFGCVFFWAFFAVVRRWFGRTVATFGTLLFIATPWLFLNTRSATPQIMLLAPLALTALLLWFRQKDDSSRSLLMIAFMTGLLLYAPGLIWFLIMIVVFWRHSLLENLEDIYASYKWLAGLLFLLALAPLIYGLFGSPWLIKQLFLVPDHWQSPLASLKSIGWSSLSLVWRAPYHVYASLGRLPLLNATQLVLTVFGGYVMWQRARQELYLLSALVVLAVVAAGLNQNLYLLILALPSFGILMVAGLRYLYGEWKSVFPLNPLPRALAITLISALIIMNLLVCARYCLIAWPKSLNSPSQVRVIQ
jgi:hypothetical protein